MPIMNSLGSSYVEQFGRTTNFGRMVLLHSFEIGSQGIEAIMAGQME